MNTTRDSQIVSKTVGIEIDEFRRRSEKLLSDEDSLML